MKIKGVPCELCHADRLRRWRLSMAANGLTPEEWPAPVAPRFANRILLALHRRKAHGEKP
jgi:hypothetical protein